MTQEEIYKLLCMDVGDHFKFLKQECRVDERPCLLVYDYEFGDWIAPRYKTMQVEYLAKNINEVKFLPVKEWHMSYSERNKKYTEYIMNLHC